MKNQILDSAAASLVPGEEFAVDNSVCSLKASKAFPADVTDVGVGGSCVGNLGGAVGNDSSEPVQMQVSPIFHASLEKQILNHQMLRVTCRQVPLETHCFLKKTCFLACDDLKLPGCS